MAGAMRYTLPGWSLGARRIKKPGSEKNKKIIPVWQPFKKSLPQRRLGLAPGREIFVLFFVLFVCFSDHRERVVEK
ncbi:MAG: hypothetical protein KKD44_01025 [Proteobacteria bacterium]|nr:hypothetical protein [Pseudomonadota bacterium]